MPLDKETNKIIISRVISSYMGPMFIETRWNAFVTARE